jgi:hypothetical protein
VAAVLVFYRSGNFLVPQRILYANDRLPNLLIASTVCAAISTYPGPSDVPIDGGNGLRNQLPTSSANQGIFLPFQIASAFVCETQLRNRPIAKRTLDLYRLRHI